MTKEEPKKAVAVVPPSPGTNVQNGGQWRPEQLDPELANLAMAKLLLEKLGTPSRINKVFNVRKAIAISLNHVPDTVEIITPSYQDDNEMWHPAIVNVVKKGNPTGIDTSIRLSLYEAWERGSVNEDGIFFDRVWAFLMKPKYILSGMAGMPMQEEEKGESLFGRAVNWFRGGKKNDPNKPN